ncbi:hypothetical protein B0T22DRAFT_236601 [Podospora appendiculata]|uniref:Uncharacterized protein n=1 Tax=Podospora appendiculata TaxID=314037 RepID=A0AAE0X728_9PEZI|nr:hypothetical protein B0T22DRAFT_236601 [Podospora appendiculata]
MMASLSADARRMQRRDSSTRSSSSKRRPRLLRASATEPSITSCNASRNALANSQSSRGATELLSRMAFISGSPPDSVIRSTSPLSARTAMYESMSSQGDLCSSPVSHPGSFDELHHHSYSSNGRYFSFPSFDMYEADQQGDEEKTEMKSP